MIHALVVVGQVLGGDIATASVRSAQDIAASPVVRAHARGIARVAGPIIVLHFTRQFRPGGGS